MSYVFISHASSDKRPLVRPLVEALVEEGEWVWVDRPGPDGLGLSQADIGRAAIDYLQSGASWSADLRSALRSSGAVVACLSRALLQEREVLVSEIAVARAMNKLVLCVLDDLEAADLRELAGGLLDLERLQFVRISPAKIEKALELRRAGTAVDELPSELREAWEAVRHLIAQINGVRTQPKRMRSQDVERLVPHLRRVPIPPVLKITSIPEELVFALGAHVTTADRAASLLDQAGTLTTACEPDSQLAQKLILRRGALYPFGSTSNDQYWTKVLVHAGLIARRTVAALLLTPIATWAMEQAGQTVLAEQFLTDLESGEIS